MLSGQNLTRCQGDASKPIYDDDHKLSVFVHGQKLEFAWLQSAAAESGGTAADCLDMSMLLLDAAGKSDGSAAKPHKQWSQETAC
jgi:hypothetical protein